MINIQSKKMLAKLLAKEDLTVVHAGICTASFDPKRRILTLPIWKDISNDIYDLFILHEVSHALFSTQGGNIFTEACMYVNPIHPRAAKRLINIVEDCRIEKLIKIKYPGGRKAFLNGYKELVDRDFFATKSRNINEFNIIDRINVYFKTRDSSIIFSPIEHEFVDRIEKALIFNDVIDICFDLYKYAKEEQKKKRESQKEENQEEKQKEQNVSQKEDSDVIDPDSDIDESDNEEDTVEPEKEENEIKKDTSKETKETNEDKKSKETTKTEKDNESELDIPIESETDKTWEKSQENLIDSMAKNVKYLGIPIPKLDQIIIPYWVVHSEIRLFYDQKPNMVSLHTNEFEKFKEENKPVVAWLQKEFEIHKAADAYRRTQISNMGIIDLHKLNRYKFEDDIMLKVATIPEGKNHILQIFVDWSGSMEPHMLGAIHQLLNLVLFAKKEQIPFDVYTFGSYATHSKQNIFSLGIEANADEFIHHKDDFAFFAGFKLRQILSSNMSATDFNDACINLLMMASSNQLSLPPTDLMGGTPLNETIVTAIEMVKPFCKKYQKVNTIFITDGEATTDHYYVGNEEGHVLPIDCNKNDIFLKDPITHIDYPISVSSMENTSQFLQIFRNRTGVNAIGFFISGDSEELKNHAFEILCPKRWIDEDSQNKLRGEFNKNGFILADDMGYNEFYIIPGGKELKIHLPSSPFAPAMPMSNRQMVTAMTDHGLKQRKQRVVLTRFIRMIS